MIRHIRKIKLLGPVGQDQIEEVVNFMEYGVFCGKKIIQTTKETALIYAHFQAKTKAEYQLVALRGIEPRFDD